MIRKGRWYDPEDASWVPPDDIRADVLNDLRTDGNVLSVFSIAEDRSNLNRVLAALAATRERIANVDYALFDEQTLSAMGLTMTPSPGVTPDEQVNRDCHRDIIQLSAHKVANLAVRIQRDATLCRHEEEDVKALVVEGLEAGRIQRQSPSMKLRQDQLAPLETRGKLGEPRR
jgi:hypothetical protein